MYAYHDSHSTSDDDREPGLCEWLYWYFRNEKKEKTVVGCKASSFIPLSSNSCVCVWEFFPC